MSFHIQINGIFLFYLILIIFLFCILFSSCFIFDPSSAPKAFIQGNITQPLTLKAKNSPYFLIGHVVIENTVLNIEPGTIIHCQKKNYNGENAALIISQGSKIIAEGTANNPIVFTSDQKHGERSSGDWGGIVINGHAKLNTASLQREGKGGTGLYGGNNDDDDSGTLRYIRVEFGGAKINKEKAFNGISFQGVGSSTKIDHIHVHMCGGDGAGFLGGNVSAKYLLCTNIEGDAFSWVEGWRGKGQFWIGQCYQQGITISSNGIEGSNVEENISDFSATPRSNPKLYNITLVGNSSRSIGIKLNRGTAGIICNAIISDFQDSGIYFGDQDTGLQYKSGDLLLQRIIFYPKDLRIDTTQCGYLGKKFNIYYASTRPIQDPFDISNPQFTSRGIAIDGTVQPIHSEDSYYQQANFIGGKAHNIGDDDWNWNSGWITFPQY